jgi:hypothetical protein
MQGSQRIVNLHENEMEFAMDGNNEEDFEDIRAPP